MAVDSRASEERVLDRLGNVLDPCSCATENPVSIVDLGLVEEVHLDDESVSVRFLPTSPMCLYMGQIMDDAERELLELDGVRDVDLEVIDATEKMWRPDRLADDLREARDGKQLIKQSAADGPGDD